MNAYIERPSQCVAYGRRSMGIRFPALTYNPAAWSEWWEKPKPPHNSDLQALLLKWLQCLFHGASHLTPTESTIFHWGKGTCDIT